MANVRFRLTERRSGASGTGIEMQNLRILSLRLH